MKVVYVCLNLKNFQLRADRAFVKEIKFAKKEYLNKTLKINYFDLFKGCRKYMTKMSFLVFSSLMA